MEAAPGNAREQPQRNKQIIFIIAIYLLLTMSSHFSVDSYPFNRATIQSIKNGQGDPSVKAMLNVFVTDKYEGEWVPLGAPLSNSLTRESGKLSMKIYKYSSSQKDDYELQFQLNNGQYIDDGSVIFRTVISPDRWQTKRNGTTIAVRPKVDPSTNQSLKVKALYQFDKVLRTIEQRVIDVEDIRLLLSYNETLKTFVVLVDIESSFVSASMAIARQEPSKMLSTITFAVLLFFISYIQFSAIMDMLRGLFEGRGNSANYSIITVLAVTMWDAVLCIVAFVQAFHNEQNLILFIMPAFILCLLFTNLELRLMLMIFAARSPNTNARDLMCRFNLITYGGLMVLYPIIIFTNLSVFFFISISLIFLPQIYTNGVQGIRPDTSSPYYKKFLPVRFLLIIYLKCFPWNIFELAPNYPLGIGCLLLVAFQMFLLWVQKNFGPKRVLPRFMLPPVFDYGCAATISTQDSLDGLKTGQQQAECAICLMPLSTESEEETNKQVPYRIMNAPCKHSFHGSCLVKWMQIKMECPQCRGKLPPFE